MFKKIGLFAGVVCVAGLLIVAIMQPRQERASTDNVSSHQKILAYQFELSSTGNLNSAAIMSALFNSPVNAPLQRIEESVSGIIVLQHAETQPTKRIAQLKMLKGTDPEMAVEFAKAVLVEQTNNGAWQLDEQEFTYSEPQRDLLLNLFSKLQVVKVDTSASVWQTTEQDNVGVYHATYKQEDAQHLTRTKTDYLQGQTRSQTMFDLPNSTLSIKESLDQITLDVNASRVDSVVSTQKIEIQQGSERVLELTQHITLTAVSVDKKLGQRVTMDELRAQYQQPQGSQHTSQSKQALSFDSNSDLVTWFSDAIIADEDRAIEQLTVWFRENPDQVRTLIEYMNTHLAEISDEVDLRLWYAMTDSGTVEAQQAFADAMSKSDYSLLIRTRAIVYSHDFVRPTQGLIDGLWWVYEHQASDVSQDEKELSSMALYALGSLINASEVDEQIQHSLSKEMLRRLDTANTDEQASEVLTALSNSRMPRFIETFETYTKNKSDRVVATAFEALANLELPRATDVLVNKLNLIESESLRERATKSLVSAVPTEKSIQWASSRLNVTQNVSEQGNLIQYLGKYSHEYPEAETSLQQLLQQPNLTVQQKRLIYRYIAPRQ
ncbi:HEAT repeat domain-containing protein [Pseudoalteromonas xiamenensis]